MALRLGACDAMEIDPKYVHAAVTRWEAFTGKKAVRQRVTRRVLQSTWAAARAAARGLLSSPMEGRPKSLAAKVVVPLPQNGSSTHCFGRLRRVSTPNGKSRGNIV